MSTALVEMFNNQPMTTSLAIAEGTGNEHKSVIQLVRKYVNDLQEFGSLAFEMRVMRKDGKGGEQGEVAFLNEQQSTLLITYLKNTEVVRKFKIALVKAFFELRDRANKTPHTHAPLTLSHRADIRVAADRTFRSVLRACRSAGVKLPQALRRANEVTMSETGINIIDDYQIDTASENVLAFYPSYLQFLDSWMKNELPVPCAPCRSSHLYLAYQHWERLQGGNVHAINTVLAAVTRHCGFSIKSHWYGVGRKACARMVVPIGQWFNGNKPIELEQYHNDFEKSLNDWIG